MPSPPQTSAVPAGTFRLLIPAAEPAPSGSCSVEVEGHHWVVTELPGLDSAGDPLDYTCVSYAWGPGKTEHPCYRSRRMSDRAMTALLAAIRVGSAAEVQSQAGRSNGIWLDALCVPPDEPARTACLQCMGVIYGNASRVVVMLSRASSALLDQIRRTDSLEMEMVLALKDDDWVDRAWTYQEIVNSQVVYFTAEGETEAPVRGDQFLNHVGKAIEDLKKDRKTDAFSFRTDFPRLSAIEDVIADWMTADYEERSAYQVMSAMHDRRIKEQKEYLFEAMIGAIATAPCYDAAAQTGDAAEHFMRICEAKGDYSFIFSDAPRSEVPGSCWRPTAGAVRAVLPWHTTGERQSGRAYPTHLQLNNMYRMIPGPITPSVRQSVANWLLGGEADSSVDTIPALILRRLRDAGFSGCGEHLELEGGYFFLQECLPHLEGAFVVVSTEVQWIFGAPGLLVRRNGADIHHYLGVGVFVGPPPRVGDSINIGMERDEVASRRVGRKLTEGLP